MRKMDILGKIKIEPQYNKGLSLRYKFVGFRGVRDGLGTTTLINHVALAISSKGLSVCVLDFDFAMPNTALSSDNVFPISEKLNRQQESIMNVVNSTEYSSLSYIGPSIKETVLDYMPMLLDETYLNARNQTINILFEELAKKFDVVLVDLPSDIRYPETVIGMGYCDKVYTVCKVDPSYIGKLQRDYAVLSSVDANKPEVYIVNVYEQIEGKEIYKTASNNFSMVTEIAHSLTIRETSLNGKIRHIRRPESCESIEEAIYYEGIQQIINDMRSATND